MEFNDFYEINGWNIIRNKIGKIREKYRLYEEVFSIYVGWLERMGEGFGKEFGELIIDKEWSK